MAPLDFLPPKLSALQATLLLLLLPGVSYTLYARYQHRKRSKGHPSPPGPSGWPVIGNALDIPLESMGPVYASWARKFGSDIVSASALGMTMVVIDSYDTAIELLEKRAAKYSCRPSSVMACELMGWDSIFVLSPYSEAWRERRKLFARYFRTNAGPDGEGVHTPQAYEFVNRFLVDLSETPNEFYGLARHMVGSMAISLAYGIPIQRRRDELIEFLDSIARMVAERVTPGNAVVDVLPWLKYIPSWMPGMGFKRFAKSVRWKAERFRMEPYDRAVKAFGTADVRPSFLSDALAKYDVKRRAPAAKEKELDEIKDVAATIFATAGDTTTDAILTFIFALSTHPEVRKRIQDELDSLLLDHDKSASGWITGKRTLRLPTFEDQDKLPLLMAAVMESQRWGPVAPIGVPHSATEDDVYNGYFIPKGAVVMANQWSMLNNENEYGVDVLEYNPDRFLRPKAEGNSGVEIDPKIRNPNTIAFGFGRRVCPGLHIAQSTLWLTAASLLTLFDFEAPSINGKANYVNKLGKVDERFDPGFLCHPKKFKCEFKLRSEEARALVGQLAMEIGALPRLVKGVRMTRRYGDAPESVQAILPVLPPCLLNCPMAPLESILSQGPLLGAAKTESYAALEKFNGVQWHEEFENIGKTAGDVADSLGRHHAHTSAARLLAAYLLARAAPIPVLRYCQLRRSSFSQFPFTPTPIRRRHIMPPDAYALLTDVNWLVGQECIAREMSETYSAELRKDMNSFATARTAADDALQHSGGMVTPGANNLGDQVLALCQMINDEWPKNRNPDKVEMARRSVICAHYMMLLSMCVSFLPPQPRAEYFRRSLEERKRYMENLGPASLKEPNWPETPNEDLQRMISAQRTDYNEANRRSGSGWDREEPLIPNAMRAHALPLDQRNKPKHLLSKEEVERYIDDRPEAVTAEGKIFMVIKVKGSTRQEEILKVHEIVESMGEKYAYLGFHNTGEDAIRFEWDSFKDFLRPGGLDAELRSWEILLLAMLQTLSSCVAAAGADFLQDGDSHTSESAFRPAVSTVCVLHRDDEELGPPYTLRVPALRIQEDQAMRQLTPSETRDYADHPEAALGKTFKAVGVNLVGVGEDEEDGDSIFKVHYLLQSKDDKVVYLGYTYSDSDAIAHSLEEFEEMLTGATQVWEFDFCDGINYIPL
ncbi:hypothetical protein NMY22_g1911 [Coprinellus aureogranulatus]|nr:hypothetical protein NMY22_g1911 [Coprinellus aureogranulatus]